MFLGWDAKNDSFVNLQCKILWLWVLKRQGKAIVLGDEEEPEQPKKKDRSPFLVGNFYSQEVLQSSQILDLKRLTDLRPPLLVSYQSNSKGPFEPVGCPCNLNYSQPARGSLLLKLVSEPGEEVNIDETVVYAVVAPAYLPLC